MKARPRIAAVLRCAGNLQIRPLPIQQRTGQFRTTTFNDHITLTACPSIKQIRWMSDSASNHTYINPRDRPGQQPPAGDRKEERKLEVDQEVGSLNYSDQTTGHGKHEKQYQLRIPTSKNIDLPMGLFGVQGLLAPSDWRKLALDCINQGEVYAEQIRSLKSKPSKVVLDLFDILSDTLCRVLDAAELCRNVHPSPQFVKYANEAFDLVSAYTQELNADMDMYAALACLKNDQHVWASLDSQERIMCSSLMSDLERGGIHLSKTARQKCIELQTQISILGSKFSATIHNADEFEIDVDLNELLREIPMPILKTFVRIPESKWNKMTATVETEEHGDESLPYVHYSSDSESEPGNKQKTKIYLAADPDSFASLLQYVKSEHVRRSLFISAYSSTHRQQSLQLLQDMLKLRQQLAELLGFSNFAEMMFEENRVAPSIDYVWNFLDTVRDAIKPKADEELSMMALCKSKFEPQAFNEAVQIWDWDKTFYRSLIRSEQVRLTEVALDLSAYFELNAVLRGLTEIVYELFGLEMTRVEMAPYETWNPDVFKYEVRDGGQLIGMCYMDLHPRPQKYNHSAHFMVRCGMSRAVQGLSFQTPIVALVCNFDLGNANYHRSPVAHGDFDRNRSPPVLLVHSQVETLFHEFGHALHSLLSRSRFQHLSGTRTPIDFVEIPSHLFEHLASDYRVLQRFAHHYVTGESISVEDVHRLHQSKRLFSGMDIQAQLVYAAADLCLHTTFAKSPSQQGRSKTMASMFPNGIPANTSRIYSDLQERFTGKGCVSGTSVESTLAHLYGYATGYYTYLYAKVFAAQIWDETLSRDPLSRGAGQVIRNLLLAPGGSVGPREILKTVLKGPPSLNAFLKEIGLPGESFKTKLAMESCFKW